MSTEGQEVSEEGQKQSVNKKKGKGGLIAVICVSAVIIAVLAGVIIYLLNRKDDGQSTESDPSRGVVVNEDNVQEVIDNLSEPTPPGMYEVVMNSTWVFPSGKEASSDAYVENSNRNANPVYFDLVLRDTGETIFESPILPVGTHLDSKDIKLSKELPAGVYDCILTYHLLDENEHDMSTVKITVVVNIVK